MKYKINMQIVNEDDEVIETCNDIEVADDAEDRISFESAEYDLGRLERHLKAHIDKEKQIAENLAEETARELEEISEAERLEEKNFPIEIPVIEEEDKEFNEQNQNEN
jgi:hypothetical protein